MTKGFTLLKHGESKNAENLPEGTEYTVTEEDYSSDGYSTTSTGTKGTISQNTSSVAAFTNTRNVETVNISVSKIWDDNNNQDGIRPAEITVQLYANGEKSGEEVSLSAANNWSYTWTKLAKNAGKKTIEYSVDEVKVPDGYTRTVTANGTKTEYTITNTHTPEITEATVKKEWNDSNDQDGKRPESLSVDLMNGNTLIQTVTLDAGNSWTATVGNLPKNAAGTAITYSWSEGSMPEGYSLTGTAKEGTVTTLTNTYAPEETSVSVRKVWTDSDNQDGIRPAEITVQLYANGEKSGEEVSLSAANNWSYTWTKLAKNAGKKTIEYSVDEVKVPDGYTRTVTANGTKTEYTITNTHTPEITSVEGEKTWDDAGNQDGKRPESITVNLLANGTKKESKTVTAGDNWKYSFKDLPKYENGKEITYTVTENAVTGYSTKIDGYNITNSYTPGKTSVTVTKKWVDNDNKSGKRPSEIKVQLYADGKESGSPVTLNEANKWTYTWTELDEKKDGTTIAYTVKEVGSVDGYETSIKGNASTGYEIINTLEPTATPTITPGTKNPTSTPSAENPNTYSGESKKTAVKTGDNTPVGGFVGLLLATAAVALSICYMKRRRR